MCWTSGRIAKCAVLAMCCLLTLVHAQTVVAQSTQLRARLIEQENQQPGATDWQLTRVRADASNFRSPWIEGYCSRQSVAAGETLDIMVSTDPPQPFQIEIFRMGYYGGLGTPAADVGSARGKDTGRANAGREEPARMPMGNLRAGDDSPRLAQRRLPRTTHHTAGARTGRIGRATWSSSSVTSGRPISCSSARTTRGKRTIAGPATTRSTRTRKVCRDRGPT